jgi:hypothetical protein
MVCCPITVAEAGNENYFKSNGSIFEFFTT